MLLSFNFFEASVKQIMYAVDGVEEFAYRGVVIDRVDDERNVLAHIYLCIPRTRDGLGLAVVKVGRENLGDGAVFVGFVEIFKSVAEESERREHENAAGASFFKFGGNVDHTVSGGDHIVNNDDVLALDGTTEVLVSLYRVASVYDSGVIASLIKHTKFETED